jgi:uncharacterized protein YeaO (DUF488 family)
MLSQQGTPGGCGAASQRPGAAEKAACRMNQVRIKRAYDPPSPEDGVRVLIDRLWPRGLKRDAAKLDLWLKEVAPSEALRRWFGHDPERWPEFKKRYRAELAKNKAAVKILREQAAGPKPLTLIYAAKDTLHNDAVVLKALLDRR